MNWLRRALAFMEDVIWPRRVKCLVCVEWSEGEFLCRDCAAALDAIRLRPSSNPDRQSVWRYDGVAKKLVHALKFSCMADAAEVLAEGMAGTVREMDLPGDTVFTWVTMPKRRYRERGIDHGRTLCEALARRCGHDTRQLLRRKRCVRTQLGLGKTERQKNLQGVFEGMENMPAHILLIDDVMTTGATTSVCAEALKAAGARKVYIITATKVI